MKRAAGVLLASASLVACESAIGLPDDVHVKSTPVVLDAGADTTEKAACAPSKETASCFKCTDEACCNEYAACQADARCGLYYKECLPKCKAAGKPYFECVVECDGEYGAGHDLFAPYNACAESSCLAECSGSPDPCMACSYASCREQTRACTSDRECDVLQACIGLCEGEPGYDACAAKCREGKSERAARLFNEKFTCLLQFCQESCTPR